MIDIKAELDHQKTQLEALIADINQKTQLRLKIEGAIEMLNLLKQQVDDEAKKVSEAEVKKVVEAEIVGK